MVIESHLVLKITFYTTIYLSWTAFWVVCLVDYQKTTQLYCLIYGIMASTQVSQGRPRV